MIRSIVFLSLIFPFLYKYSFVSSNQYEQIPIILRFISGNYLVNDWFLNTASKFGPRYFFSVYMAGLNQITNLPVIFFFHFVVTVFLISQATYKLSDSIAKDHLSSILTVIVILFGQTFSLGGNILVTGDFTVTQLSLAFSLLAISCLFRDKILLSSLLYIISAYYHPLIGFESFFIFNTSYVVYLTVTGLKKNIPDLLKRGILPFFIICIPLIYLYGALPADNIPGVLKIQIPAMMRGRHHYLPTAYPLADYLMFFLFLAISLLGFIKFKRYWPGKIKILTYSAVAICTALIILGSFSLYFYPLYLPVVMQPFRLTIYVYWLLMTGLTTVIFNGIKNNKLPSYLAIIPVFLPVAGKITGSGKAGLAAVFLGFLFILFYNRTGKTALTALFLIYFSLWRYHGKFNFSNYYQFRDQETEIEEYIRGNTPADAVFLVPPDLEKFRLVAGRAIVADWKSFPFHPGDYYQWYKRMCLLGNISKCPADKISFEEIILGYQNHSISSITALARLYKADYIVSPVFYRSLPAVFNNRYYLYKIN